MDFQKAMQPFAEQPITKQLLLDLLREYKRPHDKIDELVKRGLLVQVKRGLYIPGPNLNIASPELFLVANHLYGPSYISMESALSHWGFIPEKVYETSSVTINPSKVYRTSIGRFTYKHLEPPYYSFGIKQVPLMKKQTVLMASAEKALCDKIITTSGIVLRSVKQTIDLLVEDFRMDKEMLRTLTTSIISTWLKDAPKKQSLTILVKTLNSL